MAVAILLAQQDYEAASPGTLDAWDGYAKAGSSNHDLYAYNGGLMRCVYSVGFNAGASGNACMVEKAIGVTQGPQNVA